MSADLELLRTYRVDMKRHAKDCLKIRTKAGEFIPLELNSAQDIVHERLEAQLAECGWVRALILKGRQQGISTYIAARYYRKTSLFAGVSTFILSHEQSSSDALFAMVDRFQRSNPIAPSVGVCNTKELQFDKLQSSYIVATAGAREVGRGRSTSLFHGSEAAFWQNAKSHFAASVQAVPLMPGTEVILETTSAGPGGEFYSRWQDAEHGDSDYIAIFIPWFLSKEYRRAPPEGFVLGTDADEGELSESEYAEMFGLDLWQMAWRRAKIKELGDVATFKREYPATVSEAWSASSEHEPFIKPVLVMRARKRKRDGGGPLILGVDPASGGGDRFAVAARRGDRVLWVRHRKKIDTLEGTAWIRSLIDELKPARVWIDAGNIGAAIITNLKASGPKYAEVVRGANFGGTSQHRMARPKVPGPYNVRAEIYERLRDWLETPEGVQLPDENMIESDMTATRRKPRLDNFLMLESKDDMKKRGVKSPDTTDAIALTFTSLEYFANYNDPQPVAPFGLPDAPRPAMSLGDGLGGPTSWMG